MRKRIIPEIVLSLMLLSWNASATSMGGVGTYLGSGTDVLMQGFTWASVGTSGGYWNSLSGQVAQIAASGATMVWLPPSAASVDQQGYLPTDWYTQSNSYGSQAQLSAVINALTADNIKVIADIVVDHRSGDSSVFDYENPNWTANICGVVTTQSLLQFGYSCSSSTPDTGYVYPAAPGVNHLSSEVQSDVGNYINWMQSSMGYSGFRWDMAIGYGATFIKTYLNASTPYFSVGEYWDSQTNIENWVTTTAGTSNAFDFPFKFNLDTAVGNESYAGLVNSNGTLNGLVGQDPMHSVTFLDDHDTAYNGTSSNDYFPLQKELEGYAIILTHPGTPMIFYGHYFGVEPILLSVPAEQAAIQALVQVRKNEQINALSVCDVLEAENGLYAAVIDGKVAVKVGPNAWSPATGGLSGTWNVATSGTNYMVWELVPPASPTITPTWTINGTFTPTLSVTATPTCTSTWTATATSEPSATASPGSPPATPASSTLTVTPFYANSGGGKIISFLPALNPQAGPSYRFAVNLSNSCSALDLRIYGEGMNAIIETNVQGSWHAGWNIVTMAVPGLANGLYYVLIRSDNDGAYGHKPTYLMVLK